jgi:hypothetical protein
VRNDIALSVLERQLKPLADEWQEFSIPAGLGWKHDLIDPLGENVGNSVEIYRKILPMFGLPAHRSADSSATVTLALP